MSWKKIALANLLLTLLLLFLAESVASIAWYHRALSHLGPSAAASAISGLIDRLQVRLSDGESTGTKLEKIAGLREAGVSAFPAYLFDAQLHRDLSIYHLANPANASVVFCREEMGWIVFETDEIGFRNPPGQVGQDVDYVFVGDSYTEGACVPDSATVAGVFREKGHSVMNLGRYGSGPLFQLAILREYAEAVQSRNLVWFVFTGNDLANLREEKASTLIRYLQDDSFSQDLLGRRDEVSEALSEFLMGEIELEERRNREELPTLYRHGYGETLDALDADAKELHVLDEVAQKILELATRRGMRLQIVTINHPTAYDRALQDRTRDRLQQFGERTNTPVLDISRTEIGEQGEGTFVRLGTHMTPAGYRWLAGRVLETAPATAEAKP